MISPKKVAGGIVQKLEKDELLSKQCRLFVKVAEGGIIVNDYFQKQENLEKNAPSKGKKITWEELKKSNPEIYLHERAHYEIWQKYGVEVDLFKVENKSISYYVYSEKFKDIAIKEGFSINKIKEIQMEALKAPFSSSEYVKSSGFTDILYYEILLGEVKELKFREILAMCKKYNWVE